MIKFTACTALAMLIATSAYAEGLNDTALPGLQTSTTQPNWLSTETHSDTLLGPGGLYTGTSSQTSVKLGDGFSASIASSFYNAPGSASFSPNSVGPGLVMDPVTGLYTGAHGGLSLNPGDRFYPGAPAASNFGGTVSMDVGGGLSVNFMGGVSRIPGNGFALTGPTGLYMSPNGTYAGSVGAGVALDLGGGSSLSIAGGMTRGPACAGPVFGFCR